MSEPATSSTSASEQIPPGVMEALLRPSTNRPSSRTLESFSSGVTDVSMTESDFQVNKYDLLCPRPECGSIILRIGVGKLVEKPSVQMEPADRTPALLPPMPEPPAATHWWLVAPSPMEFENIGFSKPLSGDAGPQMKLLSCAECDLGPVGWSEVGGKEFWLACSRVGYRA
ncbi:putative N-acetyltransferase C9.02c [Mycena venus]|uniref:Putative N-acetyltransferase C9.02c n=1 Tax=Mycena venus TaxID=2733690 RepID=A0A8H7CLW3_9AGAR|nr:putative N-acetyltransferase C9.02c [Mycena venus]